MPVLSGRVTSVSWRDEVTGETVARIAPEGNNPRRISYPFWGTFAYGFMRGELVTLQGDWQPHAHHGKVFRVSRIERRPPMTRDGEIRVLTNYIQGLNSKKLAAEILEHFGGLQELIRVCTTEPQRLDEIPALARSRKIKGRLRAARWDRSEIDPDTYAMLQSAGLRNTSVQKLVRFFGAAGLRQLAQNEPYSFCRVPGIGFQSAEKVARFYAAAQGRQLDVFQPDRLMYGIADAVAHQRLQGHVCAPEEAVLNSARRMLDLPKGQETLAKLKAALGEALKQRLIIKDHGMLYTRGLHKAEGDLALHLSKLMAGGARALFRSRTAILKELADTTLSDEQKEAVVTLAHSPVSILVGGPGRGKTRTLGSFVSLLDKDERSYLLLAPTGKAAKRMAEMTGKDCQTIHKACSLNREKDVHDQRFGGTIGRRERFNVDVIIVDEASMVDLALAFELVRRIKPGRTSLVFVGDPDQLPPVAAGQVLVDLMNSQAIPIAKLTQTFRQANGSPLIDGADAINSGLPPRFEPKGYDLRLFDPSTARNHPGKANSTATSQFEVQVIKSWLGQAIARYSKDLKLDPIRDIQVYAPQRKGPLGLDELNEMLQAMLNPPSPTNNQGQLKIDGGFAIRVGDKVMQQANNYKMRYANASPQTKAAARNGTVPQDPELLKELVEVMNGQVGYVTRVDPQRREVEVKFEDLPEPVLYVRSDEWRQLAPAYAMSIHKSQGSEIPYAFIVLHDSMNPNLINRPLIYTGWTRAKQGVALFATNTAVQEAVQNMAGTVRYSNLDKRLSTVTAAGASKRKVIMVPQKSASKSPQQATLFS